MENADAPNTGMLARETPSNLDGSSLVELGSDVITQVVEGPASLALAATQGGQVVALDAARDVVWRADVGGSVPTAPAWTGEHVVVVPRSDEAVALDPDGSVAWTVPIGNDRQRAGGGEILFVRLASPAVHPSGDLIVADLAGQVQRVNPNGTVDWIWDAPNGEAVEATPAVTPQGDVVVASFLPNQEGQGTLARLDGRTGEPVWTTGVGSQVVGAPTVADGRIVLPLRDGDAVEARSLEDGSRQWSVTYDDHVTHSPTLAGGLAVAGDIRGVLRSIAIGSGEVQWTFNPLGDDDLMQKTSGGVLTVADSPAADGDGRLWVPYWNADMTTCCPPSRSLSSPFYLLDAGTGEKIDRTRFPKATHGPALHATGVWTGSDEGSVRHWALPGLLETEAFARGETVTLVTNTDRSGDWEVDWGAAGQDEGSGRPPAIAQRTLEPGDHEIRVSVGDASAATTVHVDGPAGEDQDATDPNGSTGEDEGFEGELPGPGDDANTSDDEDGTNPIPGPVLVLLVALGLAARRRRRA